jgi:hypothetical protein
VLQERAKTLIKTIGEKWVDAQLVERHDRNLRFQLGSSGGVELADVFSFVEEQQATLVRAPTTATTAAATRAPYGCRARPPSMLCRHAAATAATGGGLPAVSLLRQASRSSLP